MPTDTETEVLTETEEIKRLKQAVHADIWNITPEELARRQQADDGGEICTICRVKGCRIGPMGRG